MKFTFEELKLIVESLNALLDDDNAINIHITFVYIYLLQYNERNGER